MLRGLTAAPHPCSGLRAARAAWTPSQNDAEAKGTTMLRIYTTVIHLLQALRPIVSQIELHDRDLARQLRRAAASIALNTSEGSGCSGGTRRERYRNALGSARETGACLDVAVAFGYVDEVDAKVLDALDHIRATLFRIVC